MLISKVIMEMAKTKIKTICKPWAIPLWFKVLLNTVPKAATPTVCPSDREKVLEAVAAPRKFQPTADCTKTVKGVKEQPMPKPMTIMIPTKYGFLSYNDSYPLYSI